VAVLFAMALMPADLFAAFPDLPGDPPSPPGEDPRSPRPDVVVFVLDDIPPLDGRLWDRMPNIRKTFIDRGVRFSDAHGETPTCCPGRAGFLTGLHTHHHGTYKTEGSLFRPGETIATSLQDVGYYTIQIGKYLNLFEGVYPKLPPGWSDFRGYGGGYYGYRIWANGQPRSFGRKPKDYSTDVIARMSLDAIKGAPRNRPIFAWLTPFAVHAPFTRPPGVKRRGGRCGRIDRWQPLNYMEKRIGDKPRHIRKRKIRAPRGYRLDRICRGLIPVDHMVGRVVRELDRQDRLDNTILILTSDNGMTYGAHRILFDKKTPYATQIPFYVRWPRILEDEPRVESERIQNIDLAPTLCDIAGCRLGPYPTGQRRPDGISFLDLLTDERDTLGRDAVLSSYMEVGGWLPPWWSVTTTSDSALAGRGCKTRREGGCRWLYVQHGTGEKELYEISNGPCYAWKRRMSGDPCMLSNLARKKRFRGIEADLSRRLVQLRREN
jgi:arylsulfatase A-like enzyme